MWSTVAALQAGCSAIFRRVKLAGRIVDENEGGLHPSVGRTRPEKSLHAKIGELTLANDFLEGALTKAGLLSAKR